jgi:hypothetical protein
MASRETTEYRPRSYAEILDGSVRHYRSQFVRLLIPFLPMAAIDLVNALVTTVLQVQTITAGDENAPGLSFALLGVAMVGSIARWGANVLGSAANVFQVRADLEGRSLSAREGWDLARRHVWMLLGLLIVVTFVVGIGFFALIVPGIYLAVRFSVAVQVLLLERRDVGDALARSGELVRGHFWRAIALMIVLWILMTILSLPAAGLGVFSVFFLGEDGKGNVGVFALLALGQVAAVFATAILSPLAPLVFTHFYWDLRARRESSDVSTLQPAPESAA